ncbi:MAG: hypothetical protein A3E68_02005 [Candidatus Levybacteria bacterium RIFCSPHIGHO2_12_FULL_39_39]|nr:MAG: hypothetical protein A3E68_02005 [Candidatus Levybacteria bacterium RIFCSPHIGHO2_12_FULL_39_39]
MKMKTINKASKAEYYFRRYLAVTPLSLALQRSAEAKYFASAKLSRPILDLGCGFGEFAVVFFDKKVDVGIDIDPRELAVAARENKYKKLVLGDARNLPFKDNSFATIISVSTLEHIGSIDKVFKEAFRVLKPEGTFVFTLVTNKWERSIFYGPLLNRLGLKPLGNFYTFMFNKIFKHKPLKSTRQWERHIKKAGFKINVEKEMVSSRIALLFDLFLITAWPAQLMKFIFGKRMVWRPKFATDLLTKLFLRYVEEEERGTNLFVVARKPA